MASSALQEQLSILQKNLSEKDDVISTTIQEKENLTLLTTRIRVAFNEQEKAVCCTLHGLIKKLLPIVGKPCDFF
jgi:hypothetical protein